MLISWQKKKSCLKSLIPCIVQLESWKKSCHGESYGYPQKKRHCFAPTANCKNTWSVQHVSSTADKEPLQAGAASLKQPEVAPEGKAPVDAAVVAAYKKAFAANSGDSDKVGAAAAMTKVT